VFSSAYIICLNWKRDDNGPPWGRWSCIAPAQPLMVDLYNGPRIDILQEIRITWFEVCLRFVLILSELITFCLESFHAPKNAVHSRISLTPLRHITPFQIFHLRIPCAPTARSVAFASHNSPALNWEEEIHGNSQPTRPSLRDNYPQF
jgi:hypothetical protein